MPHDVQESGLRAPNNPGCTGKWSDAPQPSRMHRAVVRGPPTPQDAQDSSQRAPQHLRMPRAVVREPPGALLGGSQTYLASCLIVVAVHGRAGVGPVLPRICELPGHHPAKIDVLAATAPLPAVARRAQVTAAASADSSGALGA